MAEPSFSNLIDIVQAKSKFLLFSQACKELGLLNDMEGLVPELMNVHRDQTYSTQEFRSLWLNLKTHLYDTEDMLDNLDTLREVVIKATQGKVGDSGDIGNLLQWLDDPGKKRVDLVQRMRANSEIGEQGSFALKMICCGSLFAFMAFLLNFYVGIVG